MATGEEIVELLGRTPMFRELSRRDLEQLAQVAVPRTYGRGQVVFRQGDHGDTCYIVRTGSVRVTHDHTDGRTITLAELRPGDMFGELAMFDSESARPPSRRSRRRVRSRCWPATCAGCSSRTRTSP